MDKIECGQQTIVWRTTGKQNAEKLKG